MHQFNNEEMDKMQSKQHTLREHDDDKHVQWRMKNERCNFRYLAGIIILAKFPQYQSVFSPFYASVCFTECNVNNCEKCHPRDPNVCLKCDSGCVLVAPNKCKKGTIDLFRALLICIFVVCSVQCMPASNRIQESWAIAKITTRCTLYMTGLAAHLFAQSTPVTVTMTAIHCTICVQ